MARAREGKILVMGTRVHQAILGASKLKVISIFWFLFFAVLKISLHVLLWYGVMSVFFTRVLLTVHIRETCEEALSDVSRKQGFVDETHLSAVDQIKALNLVFEKATEDDTPTEVSIDVFVCSYDYPSS